VLQHPGERWGKDKKKIEKEREKREAYFSTMASLFILSSLPSKSF
jgi:hypothetical protein